MLLVDPRVAGCRSYSGVGSISSAMCYTGFTCRMSHLTDFKGFRPLLRLGPTPISPPGYPGIAGAILEGLSLLPKHGFGVLERRAGFTEGV